MRREENEKLNDFRERERMADEQADLCRAEQNRINAEVGRWNVSGGPDKAARGILDRMNLPANHRDPNGKWR